MDKNSCFCHPNLMLILVATLATSYYIFWSLNASQDQAQVFLPSTNNIKVKDTNQTKNTTMVNALREAIAEDLKSLKENPLGLQVGQPRLKILLFSSWRSGSSVFEHLLASYPGSLNYPEPLFEFGINVFRNYTERSQPAIDLLRHIITCNFTFIQTGRENHRVRMDWLRQVKSKQRLNTFLYDRKQPSTRDALTAPELDAACNLFPISVLKIVRATLDLMVPSLLQDPALLEHTRIVVLVRDPRSVLLSRHPQGWCKLVNQDCNNPFRLCESDVRNYYTAKALMATHPDIIRVVRFEDWVTDTVKVTFDLFKHFGLMPTKKVTQQLKDIKRGMQRKGHDSSKEKWILGGLEFDEVEEIQTLCQEAMGLWGYKNVESKKELSQQKDSFVWSNWTMPGADDSDATL